MTWVVIIVGGTLFLLALVASIHRAACAWHSLRRQNRRLAYTCDRCGYAREGSRVMEYCPECGQTLTSILPPARPASMPVEIESAP